MAPSDDRRAARGGSARGKGRGQKSSGRNRRREGGFGPHGAPRVPERERRPDEPSPRPSGPARSALRVKGERRRADEATTGRTRASSTRATTGRSTRRRRRSPDDVEREVLGLGGRRGPWLLERLMRAADAFSEGRDQEALTLIRPVRNAVPDATSVRELTGLVHYRLGNYRAAAKELEAFTELTGSVEQHPVLMDCYRAQRRWARVDDCWQQLAEASPAPELMTEGRIVAAGALADQGKVGDAIALLDRKATAVKRARPDHLRLWYALADLEERAGNLPRARELFGRVHATDPDFADVGTRRAGLR